MTNKDVIECIAPSVSFGESGYSSGDSYWSAASLYEQAEKEGAKPYKLKIRDIDFSVHVWKSDVVRLADYCYHAKRANECDPDIPVLVGPMGGIMDGFHRVMRAVMFGYDHVMAVRIKDLPPESEDPEGDDDA